MIDVRGVRIGDPSFLVMMAGPCTVETQEQLMVSARAVKAAGAHILRGGAFKPSTSPYSFHGHGEAALKMLAEAREELDMPIITEVLDVRDVEMVCGYADILQIGTRNMTNFSLLREVGKTQTPVMLKRGMAATIEEWLQAAEYIASAGQQKHDAVRAGHPDIRNVHAQHVRYQRHPRGQRTVAPADYCRSVARDRQSQPGQCRLARRCRRRARTA